MPELSKIRKNGIDYDIKDATARQAIKELQGSSDSSQNVDLTGYATEKWVREGYQPKGNYLTAVPDGYAKTEDIPTKVSQLTNDKGYLTEHQDISGKADTVYVNEQIADVKANAVQQIPLFANSIEECTDTSKLYVLPDGFIYAYMMYENSDAGGEPLFTNALTKAINSDGTPYLGENGEVGYKTGYRLSSGGTESTSASHCCTGFIPVTDNDTVRVKNITGTGLDSNGYVHFYKSDFTKYGTAYESAFKNTLTDGVYVFTPVGICPTTENIAYMRISMGVIDDTTIITVNEEIAYSEGSTETGYAWQSTGRAFVPADYEDRIIVVEKSSAEHTTKIAALEKAVESGSTDETETAALEKIKVWDKPVYDPAPVTLIADDRMKPALTTSDRTIEAIYAKYRALMAAHPDYITETNMGPCTASDTFAAVDMLRFDFCEPGGLTQPDMADSGRHETKPKLIFISGIHTEWAGVWGLYYALEEIVTNPDFDDIRRNAHIIVVPCANPFCLSSERTLPDGWGGGHVNANGVAIHNNFGVDHSTSGSVGEYNYGGTEPYSELETQYIDAVMAENPDAVAFVSCHNNDYSTYYGSHVIWASSATYHMCNVAFRLIDKLTKAWLDKYGDTLKDAIDEYKINMDEDDYRLGRATMSSSKGTEQKNATKYGIQGVNLEISRMMKVFSGDTDGTSEVMTHGAEVYANFMRTLLWVYDHKDKKEYAPNLPWSE